MQKTNAENPVMFDYSKDEVLQEIARATKCYFYDTSAFRNHASLSCRNLILKYIAQMQGVVIITRSVYMELCSTDGRLWDEHTAYIHEMKEMGIKVLFVLEETIVELLQLCYNNISKINEWLSYAVKCVKCKYGSIEATLEQDAVLRQEILVSYRQQDKLLGRRFFERVRDNKVAGDNLGEELLCVCLHLLTNIPEMISYKYVMLSDDKNAVRLVGQVKQNVARNMTQKYLTAHTSTNLCWQMKQSGIILCKEDLVAILKGEKGNTQITTYCSERYSLFPEMQTVSCEELADKIMEDDIIVYM